MTPNEMLLQRLKGTERFVAFANTGALAGTYCFFLPAAGADGTQLWSVAFSPPYVDGDGMVNEATIATDIDGTNATLAMFDGELVFAPPTVADRLARQLVRGADAEPSTAPPPAGPYVNAAALVSHLVAAIGSGRTNPWLLFDANLPDDPAALERLARDSEVGLQTVINLLESIGCRLTVRDAHDAADVYPDGWSALG